MSNRSNGKLLGKLIDKLTPDQVEKLLSVFKVNGGTLKISHSHEIMLVDKGSVSALNRVETVGIRDFSFNEVEAKVEAKVESFNDDHTVVLDDDK